MPRSYRLLFNKCEAILHADASPTTSTAAFSEIALKLPASDLTLSSFDYDDLRTMVETTIEIVSNSLKSELRLPATKSKKVRKSRKAETLGPIIKIALYQQLLAESLHRTIQSAAKTYQSTNVPKYVPVKTLTLNDHDLDDVYALATPSQPPISIEGIFASGTVKSAPYVELTNDELSIRGFQSQPLLVEHRLDEPPGSGSIRVEDGQQWHFHPADGTWRNIDSAERHRRFTIAASIFYQLEAVDGRGRVGFDHLRQLFDAAWPSYNVPCFGVESNLSRMSTLSCTDIYEIRELDLLRIEVCKNVELFLHKDLLLCREARGLLNSTTESDGPPLSDLFTQDLDLVQISFENRAVERKYLSVESTRRNCDTVEEPEYAAAASSIRDRTQRYRYFKSTRDLDIYHIELQSVLKGGRSAVISGPPGTGKTRVL